MVASEVVEALQTLPCGRRLLAVAQDHPGMWLVGGAVRDLLLGRTPRELDIAVEGDVQDVARALGGEVRLHERFGTATVVDGACRFDLARTRIERYPAPGALPEVTWAGVEDDLRRRDVTVNAIAVSLPDGRMIHVDRALEDLDARMLDVLHAASLQDDPTRVWRIARYAARLGFTVAPEVRLQAANLGRGEVSGERIGNELRLALAEPDPCSVFEQLEALCPWVLPEGFAARPAPLAAALEVLPADGRRDLTVLAACTGPMDLDAARRWLEELGFAASDRDVVLAASRWVTGAPLRAATSASEIARAAAGAPIEAVALAGGEQARRWIEELRDVRLDITGADLVAAGVAPGPQLGERLQRVLDAKLDGRVMGREDELALALGEADA
ncbi:unannotated protein [freshwater metagenome]|uniref:Unannotated protein n=1 Tax=freshwater metagenome TaxID=449393 RepID=A0A6J7I3Z4_9ZZZZ